VRSHKHAQVATHQSQAQQLEQQQQHHADQHSLQQSAAVGATQHAQLLSVSSLPSYPGVQISLGLTVALLALSMSSEPAAAADGMHQHQHSIQPIMDLAEGEEFWGNVARYGRYFVTVMLGTGYVMAQPVIAAFKRPVTAIGAIVAITGTFVLLKFVLNAMLGVDEPFQYEPGSIVPYNAS
jgi:hypothetical protein